MENELKKIKRYYKRYDRFLLDKNNIPADCIVFIEDKQLIYTHNTFFGRCECMSREEIEALIIEKLKDAIIKPNEDIYSLVIPKAEHTFTYNGQDHTFDLSYTTLKNGVDGAADQIRWTVVLTGGVYELVIDSPNANGTLNITIPSAVGTYTVGVIAYWGNNTSISDSITCLVIEEQPEDTYSIEILETGETSFIYDGSDHTLNFSYVTKKNNQDFAANSINWNVVQTGGIYTETVESPTARGIINATVPNEIGTYTIGIIAYFDGGSASNSITCNVIQGTPVEDEYLLTITGGGVLEYTGSPITTQLAYTFTKNGNYTAPDSISWSVSGGESAAGTPAGVGELSVVIPESPGTYTVTVTAISNGTSITQTTTYTVVKNEVPVEDTYDFTIVGGQNLTVGSTGDISYTFKKNDELAVPDSIEWKMDDSLDTTSIVPQSSGHIKITFIEVGTHTIYVTAKSGSTSITKSTFFVVNKANPTFRFSSNNATATIGQPFTAPTLSAPVDLLATYASSNSRVATVNANTGEITLLTSGVVTITASTSGNDYYNSASDSYTLTVQKGTVNMSFRSNTATATVGESFEPPVLNVSPSVSVTYTSSNKDVATVDSSSGAITLVSAGTTRITASFAGNSQYNAASAYYTLTVNQAVLPQPGEDENPGYAVVLTKPTAETLATLVDTTASKPTTPQTIDMSSASGPVDTYLTYPLEWETRLGYEITSPVVTSNSNNFEMGFYPDDDTPVITVNGVQYRICVLGLGKGTFTIVF